MNKSASSTAITGHWVCVGGARRQYTGSGGWLGARGGAANRRIASSPKTKPPMWAK